MKKTSMKQHKIYVLAIALMVAGTASAQMIGTGSFHSMVLCPVDSMVRSWGGNSNGQLGVNDTNEYHLPVIVKGPSGAGYLRSVVAIVARENFSLALRRDSTVWGWGFNGDGELGNNASADSWTPVQVHGPSNVGFLTAIKAISGGYAHVLALRRDSTVWAWGDNTNGELGNNTTINDSTPVQVMGPGGVGMLGHIVAIAAGQQLSYALRDDSTLWAWGDNSNGALGDNTTTERHTPVQVRGPLGVGFLSRVISVKAGGSHVVALRSDSTVWAWGFNINGELGNNNTFSDSVPAEVLGPGGVGHLSGAVSIGAGDYFSAAIKADSTVMAWGFNAYGQLGQDDTAESNVPVEVHGPANVGFLNGIVAVSLGDEHAVALKSNGTYWAWGWNGNGQLGDDSTTGSFVPVAVSSPCSVTTGVPVASSSAIQLNLYPNPASGQINIESGLENIERVEICNVLGQKVWEERDCNRQLVTVDVSALATGVYIARVKVGNSVVTKQFVAEK